MEETCRTAYQIYLDHNELIESTNISKRRETIIYFINSFYNTHNGVLNYVNSSYFFINIKNMCKFISFSEDDLYKIMISLSRFQFNAIDFDLLDNTMRELFR